MAVLRRRRKRRVDEGLRAEVAAWLGQATAASETIEDRLARESMARDRPTEDANSG
jgi:hypothetical protein